MFCCFKVKVNFLSSSNAFQIQVSAKTANKSANSINLVHQFSFCNKSNGYHFGGMYILDVTSSAKMRRLSHNPLYSTGLLSDGRVGTNIFIFIFYYVVFILLQGLYFLIVLNRNFVFDR